MNEEVVGVGHEVFKEYYLKIEAVPCYLRTVSYYLSNLTPYCDKLKVNVQATTGGG